MTLVLSLIACCFAGLLGYFRGWGDGEKDTERRWADAVGRKESQDFQAGFQRGLAEGQSL